MSPGTILGLVATVLAVDGGRAEIDKGLVNGLRPGDRGLLHYRLQVGEEEKRIDLGEVELLAVAERTATVDDPGDKARPGLQVAFEIPQERLGPAQTVAAARRWLGPAEAERLTRELLEELLPAAAEPPTEPAPPPPPEPHEPVATVVIPAGSYAIGADLDDAAYFNEHPRFEQRLEAFRIYLAPAAADDGAAGFLTGLSWAEAQRYCADRAMRLPTEFEWEAAAAAAGADFRVPLFEWTASWYQAYPGNPRVEEAYGERYRVIRGARDPSSAAPYMRRYLEPQERRDTVGFRCAAAAAG